MFKFSGSNNLKDLELVVSAVLNSQHEINSKVEFLGLNMEAVMAKVCPDESIIQRPEGMPPLKCKTESDIMKLNQFLDSPMHRRALVCFLFHCEYCNFLSLKEMFLMLFLFSTGWYVFCQNSALGWC